MTLPHKKFKIITFEEKLLTDTEREERNKEREEDKELAAYYRNLFKNAESYLDENENQDEIAEDDSYIWDEDI